MYLKEIVCKSVAQTETVHNRVHWPAVVKEVK
jgi:hypothetical protein